jgi:hypothetical protein
LDPEQDDLTRERIFKIEEKVIETRVQKANATKIQVELRALQECIQERDVLAQRMTDAKGETLDSREEQMGEDPTVGESRVEGENLHETMADDDTFEKDIQKGYKEDKFFKKVLENVEGNPLFRIHNGMMWTRNRGGEEVMCIPSAKSLDTTARARIIEQAHWVVGHFRMQRMSDYIRRWYWWPKLQSDVDSDCRTCKTCA